MVLQLNLFITNHHQDYKQRKIEAHPFLFFVSFFIQNRTLFE